MTGERGRFGIEDANKAVSRLRHDAQSGHSYHTVAEFHAAFISGSISPLDVSKTLLRLIETSSEHAKAFLDINSRIVLAAAEESSKRYQAGKPLGILDGVPVGVKDEGTYISGLLPPHSYSLCR